MKNTTHFHVLTKPDAHIHPPHHSHPTPLSFNCFFSVFQICKHTNRHDKDEKTGRTEVLYTNTSIQCLPYLNKVGADASLSLFLSFTQVMTSSSLVETDSFYEEAAWLRTHTHTHTAVVQYLLVWGSLLCHGHRKAVSSFKLRLFPKRTQFLDTLVPGAERYAGLTLRDKIQEQENKNKFKNWDMVQIKTQKTAQERETILISEGSQLFSNTKCLRNNIFQTFRQPKTNDIRCTSYTY